MSKPPYIPRSARGVELRTPKLPHEPAYQDVPHSISPAPTVLAWESFVIPLPFKKYAGKTLRQVLTEDPRYLRWLYALDLSRHPDLDEAMDEMVDAKPLMFEDVIIDLEEMMFFAVAAIAADGKLQQKSGLMRRPDGPFYLEHLEAHARELWPPASGFTQHAADYHLIPKPGDRHGTY